MALCSENVESARSDDLLGFDRDVGLHRGEHLVPSRFEFFWVIARVEPRLVEFGHRDEFGVSTEHDVGSATRHVGGNGYSAESARLGDDGRFACVVLRVEHFVLNSALGEQLRQHLALLDRHGSHEDRLALLVTRGDVLDNLSVLGGLGCIDEVGLVETDHRTVRRNRHDTQLVGRPKFGGFGFGGTRHSRELLVQTEIVLQRDGGQRLVFSLDLDALFGLDGLVNTFVVPATRQNSAGVFVDDSNLAVHHDVVLVASEQFLRLD